jgi:hypothetical protein
MLQRKTAARIKQAATPCVKRFAGLSLVVRHLFFRGFNAAFPSLKTRKIKKRSEDRFF